MNLFIMLFSHRKKNYITLQKITKLYEFILHEFKIWGENIFKFGKNENFGHFKKLEFLRFLK